MPRRARKPFHIVSLKVDESGSSVHLSLDLPPCLDPPPGKWPPADVKAHVEWEVRQLQHVATPGLVEISTGGAPAMAVDEHGEAVRCVGSPPLVVHARLSGADDSAYYDETGLRVRMVVDESYPASPPTIHFMQTVHHFFLDNENGLPNIFYELLADPIMITSTLNN